MTKRYKKLSNCDVRIAVQNHEEFNGNNLYARVHYVSLTDEYLYVVCSYGAHFPLFIYHYTTDTWFENEDRYSVTTSKHRSQAHPLVPTKKASTTFMKTLISQGLVESVGNTLEAA